MILMTTTPPMLGQSYLQDDESQFTALENIKDNSVNGIDSRKLSNC